MNTQALEDLCKKLQLTSVAKRVTALSQQARRQKTTYETFLFDLLTEELEIRLQRRAMRRVKEAKFPSITAVS